MRTTLIMMIALSAIFSTNCKSTSATTADTCAPLGMNHSDLLDLKANGFDTKEPDKLAIALVDCLGDSNPKIRDGVAYEAMTKWLRAEALSPRTIKQLKADLMSASKTSDENGFMAPFAALVLSEVARVDRVSPYLSAAQRSAFVIDAADYVSSVTDYRGFYDGQGWRHGVAHGADWLMQLSLNRNATKNDLDNIRSAVASQVSPPGHAYIHGESERLARPILFMAMRDEFTEQEWTDWMLELASPAPLEEWGDAFSSEEALSRVHNIKAFLSAVYVNASMSSNPNVNALLPGTTEALKKMP